MISAGGIESEPKFLFCSGGNGRFVSFARFLRNNHIKLRFTRDRSVSFYILHFEVRNVGYNTLGRKRYCPTIWTSSS